MLDFDVEKVQNSFGKQEYFPCTQTVYDSLLHRGEKKGIKTLEQGENVGYQHFLLVLKCFQKPFQQSR